MINTAPLVSILSSDASLAAEAAFPMALLFPVQNDYIL
jgi:hypothetical protein